jgi:hypothetical protein
VVLGGKPHLEKLLSDGLSQSKTGIGRECPAFGKFLDIAQPVSPGFRLGFDPRGRGIGDAITMRMDNNINKATFSLMAIATLVFAAIMAKVHAAVNSQVPEGYEDEAGFHFGSPTSRN